MIKKLTLNKGVALACLFFLLLVVAQSCRKDVYFSSSVGEVEINDLKKWQIINFDQNNAVFAGMKPNYEGVYVNDRNSEIVYEIKLNNTENIFSSNSSINSNNLLQTFVSNNIKQIVFVKNNIITNGYYMVTRSDKDIHYMQTENFTGTISYYNLKGNYVNGWEYKNGKVLYAIKPIVLNTEKYITTVTQNNSMLIAKNKLITATTVPNIKNNLGNTKQVFSLTSDSTSVPDTTKLLIPENFNTQNYAVAKINCSYGGIEVVYRTACVSAGISSSDWHGYTFIGGSGDSNCTTTVGYTHTERCDALGNGGGGGGGVVEPAYPVDPVAGGGESQANKPLVEIKKDSLASKFPCAKVKILDELEKLASYNKMVKPFLAIGMKPTITWNATIQSWGSQAYSGGTTGVSAGSGLGMSSDINLNSNMLQNSSQLLIAAVAIHETYHAYINYMFANNVDVTLFNKSQPNYMAGLYQYILYEKSGSGNNYTDHYNMLTSQFDNMTDILLDFGKGAYTVEECRKALLFGMNNAGPNANSAEIQFINQAYSDLLQKYGYTSQSVNSFQLNQVNAPTNKKLPTSGC